MAEATGSLDPLHSQPESDAASEQRTRALMVDDVVDAVRNGRCILFLGSGVHWPPPDESDFVYPDAARPLSAGALRDQLAERSRWDEAYDNTPRWDLPRMAQYYDMTRTRGHLAQEVQSAVDEDKNPSPVVDALAQLNFPVVVTTNYDRLFEKALRAHGKDPDVAVYSPTAAPLKESSNPTEQRPFVFKLHGDIGNPESIVITDEDYIQFVLRMSNRDPTVGAVPMTLQYFFKVWPTLFIGYSLMDYNLRLLFKTLRWRLDEVGIPDTYSVDVAPDPLIQDVWEKRRRLVRFIVQDVWAFVPELYVRVTGKELKP
jgi:hypothetical protein